MEPATAHDDTVLQLPDIILDEETHVDGQSVDATSVIQQTDQPVVNVDTSVDQTILQSADKNLNQDIHKYKTKCVKLSCIIGSKAVKLQNLQRVNEHLKNQIEPSIETDLLTAEDIQELNKVPFDQMFDMTFVRESLQKLYHNNLDTLKYRSLTGRKPSKKLKTHAKEPITPKKKEVIASLYQARIGVSNTRKNKLNQHISNSILRIVQAQNNKFKKRK